MVFLEIEHPDRERLILPLDEGTCIFPAAELELPDGQARLVFTVDGENVHLEPLGASGPHATIPPQARVELRMDDPVQVEALTITLRTEEEQRLRPSFHLPRTGPDPRLHGRDRWILMALVAAGHLGRADLQRVITIYRNKQIEGAPRSVPQILRKHIFKHEYEAAVAEVEAALTLSCRRCRRAFDPDAPEVPSMRCPGCHRRLTCQPREPNHVRDGRVTPRHLRFDRVLPQTRIAHFKVEHLLGVGGYGAVYKAFDTRRKRIVALKLFPSGGEIDVRREWETVARLPVHPNLVQRFENGVALGFEYISYEYVEGRSLAYFIARRRPLKLDVCLGLLRDVLTGLSVAHGLGVIHRDIKPDNILLARVEGRFIAKLTDFGLGAHLPQGQDDYASRTLRGAPEYLAPEQFRTHTSSVASDLYGIGATFFHLLARRLPFEAETDYAMAWAHLEDPVPSLKDHRVDGPRALEQLFRQLLAKAPDARPASAAVALERLDQVERDLVRRREWASRRFWLASGVVAALLGLAAIMVFVQGGRRGWPVVREWVAGLIGPDHVAAARGEEGADPGPGPGGDEGVQQASDDGSQAARAGVVEPTVTEPPGQGAGEAAGEGNRDAEAERAQVEEQADRDLEQNQRPVEEGHEEELRETTSEPSSEGEESRPQAPVPPPMLVQVSELTQGIREIRQWRQSLAPAPASAAVEPEREEARQFAVRRLRLLEDLFVDARLIKNEPALPVEFMERHPRGTLLENDADPTGGLRSLPMPVYGAADVRAWLAERRAEIESCQLADVLTVRPATAEEVVAYSADASGFQLLEWVQVDEGGKVALFDHAAGRIRPQSADPDYRRRSVVRLHVTLLEASRIIRVIEDAMRTLQP